VNDASPSLQLDARALALLDRLLDATAADRAADLDALSRTEPALHERMQRLLVAAETGDGTRGIAASVLQAQRQFTTVQPAAGDLVAGWRLLRELGQGGMSTVWLAERAEGGLKRLAALKFPLAPHLSGVLARRFARERDVLASLDHPHIARLLDAGVAAHGQPYIVLEAVTGSAITRHADTLRLDTRQRLALFQQVLAAVEHAHAHMVVHRDLKPSNILVSEQGQVKLLDFGIAKLLEGGPGSALTQDAAAVLTPRYAAPEQVLGDVVTAATDIYAAAVVLYELLVGSMPYGTENGTAMTMMQAVARDTPRPPGLGRDIDTVLLKALAKDPAQRYASIERFAEDIRRLLDSRPILARRVPAWQRLRLLVRRQPLATVAALTAAVALLTAGGLAWNQADQSAAQRLRADAVREFIVRLVADAEPAEGHTEVSGVEMIDAAVTSARRDIAEPRLRGELLGALGHVYIRLRELPKAQAALDEALSLLQAHTPAEDASRNQALAGLARVLEEREPERAAAMARQVLSTCTQAGAECAKARAEADFVLSACEGWQGRDAEALRYGQAYVRETGLGYGQESLEMASALEFFTGAARNNGRLQEAADAIARARAIAGNRTMRATSRIRMDLVQAAIDADLGRYTQAQDQLQRLLQQAAPWYERAAQWRMMASVQTYLGDLDEAIAAADASLRSLPADWDHTAQASYARQVRGVALSRSSRHEEARAALSRAHADLHAAGYDETSAALVRLRRHEAEALLRAGQAQAAAATLSALAQLPALQAVESGHIALAQACAAARLGQQDLASKLFDGAAAALTQALPEGHPQRQRPTQLRAAPDCAQMM
jgi:tetratricopeptide (TPR) repeat protein